MAIRYPANFIADIQGKETSLTPVLVIRLATPIYISTNSLTIDGNSVRPLLLKVPFQKESIDIE